MRRFVTLTVCGALLLVVLSAPPVRGAELTAKTYVFKRGVTLEMGADLSGGLRLDSIRFYTPQSIGSRMLNPGGAVKAEITLSNMGVEASRFGIAIALLDEEDRLLAVASGGNRLALRPERQGTYTLEFADVKAEAFKATTFKISIETKP